jgi:hypothetical protein
MNRWVYICALISLFAFVGGCKKQANDQDAIRATIEKRLNGRSDLNMGAMAHEYKQIDVNGDHATAQVEFRLKNGVAAGMTIDYSLQRQGGEWTVVNSQPTGHPGMDQMPANGTQGGAQGTLPSFDDLMKGQQPSKDKSLPAGHPPIGGNGSPGGSSYGTTPPPKSN